MLYAVAVFDRAAQVFARPFYVTRPAEALRSFGDEVNRKPSAEQQNSLFSHHADYELFQLGLWDENTGMFENNNQLIARASDLFRGE